MRYLSRRLSKVMFFSCHCTLYVNSAESPSLAASSTSLEISTYVTASLLGIRYSAVVCALPLAVSSAQQQSSQWPWDDWAVLNQPGL